MDKPEPVARLDLGAFYFVGQVAEVAGTHTWRLLSPSSCLSFVTFVPSGISIMLTGSVGMSGPPDVERTSQTDGLGGNCDLTDFHSAASEDCLDDQIT